MAMSMRTLLSQINLLQKVTHGLLVNRSAPVTVALATSYHPDPKFKRLRGRKYLKPELHEDYEKRMDKKQEGQLPQRSYQGRTINITSSGGIMEEYKPPEGDGISAFLNPQNIKKGVTKPVTSGRSALATRKIKSYDETFNIKEFPLIAEEIYFEAQDLLNDFRSNEKRLHELVTEYAYPAMTFSLEHKTLRWKFVESIEPPRVVQVRTQDMLSKDNQYGQITVRFYTKQILAIYDRFGRLMYGTESKARDVLEYIVFEKHISSTLGIWRMHSKVIPEWMPPKDPLINTYRKEIPKVKVKEEVYEQRKR